MNKVRVQASLSAAGGLLLGVLVGTALLRPGPVDASGFAPSPMVPYVVGSSSNQTFTGNWKSLSIIDAVGLPNLGAFGYCTMAAQASTDVETVLVGSDIDAGPFVNSTGNMHNSGVNAVTVSMYMAGLSNFSDEILENTAGVAPDATASFQNCTVCNRRRCSRQVRANQDR